MHVKNKEIQEEWIYESLLLKKPDRGVLKNAFCHRRSKDKAKP